MEKMLKNIAKGFVIGASMLVPGVSGGVMAILLDIYDQLIAAVSGFFRDAKQNIVLLGTVLIGGLIGLLLVARPLGMLREAFPLPTMYFFIGAVIGGIPPILRKGQVKKFTWRALVYPAIGAAFVLALSALPDGIFAEATLDNGLTDYLLLAFAGLISAVALVLPGISVSFMFLMLGIYDQVLAAISTLYLPYLLPLGIGLIIGIFASARLIEVMMNKFPRATYLVILGFILGSIIEIFPGAPTGMQWLACLITLCAGAASILLMTRFATGSGRET